jgi:hypothetical protein
LYLKEDKNEQRGKITCKFSCFSVSKILAIMLERDELGENPSQGGTNISFVHWTGTKFRLSFSHQTDPSDHHLIMSPCSEKATSPCREDCLKVQDGINYQFEILVGTRKHQS